MDATIVTRDWNAAWQSAREADGFSHRDKEFWNQRAESFIAHSNHKSDYPEQLLKIIRPEPEWNVLDVGCGPGTIAIPMAKMVAGITALDFADRMMTILKKRCAEKNISNITAVEADWQDDWQQLGIGTHDLVIASRSFTPNDMAAGISKLNRFATRQVCVTAPVGGGPLDKRILAAAGRPFQPGPDYIYILNQLHQMGIYARLDFTIHPVNRSFADHDDALEESHWMIPEMTPDEKVRLQRFFKKHLVYVKNRWILPGSPTVRWAVIRWEVSGERRISEYRPT